MSMFGSKRVYTTESYTSPLLVNSDLYSELNSQISGEGKPWPSLIRQTVATSIIGNRNLGADLIANLVNGVYTKSKALYAYGKLGENQEITGGFVRGLPTGKMVYTPSGSPSQVKVVIEKELGSSVHISSTMIDEEEDGNLWYDIEYYLLNGSGQITGSLLLWRYDTSLGTHPNLDAITNQEDESSPYFPIIPIRENLQQLSVTDPTLYASSRHALRSIGIKADDLDEAVHDAGNVDLGDLNHCHVILAVDVATRVPNSNLYLHAYFNKLHSEEKIKEEDYAYWNVNTRPKPANWDDVTSINDGGDGAWNPPPPPVNKVEVSDGTYKMVLGWLYSTKTIQSGNIGKLNQVVKTFTAGGTSSIGSGRNAYSLNGSTLTLQKQITLTEYEEIVVHGLVHVNFVTASGKSIRTTLDDAFLLDSNEDRNNFIIPLRVDVMQGLGALRTHDLLYDSVRAVFSSHSYVKLKWYQTGLFKLATVAVVVAITIATAGTMTPAALAGLAISTAVTTVLISFAVEAAFLALQDLAGPEFALVVAVAAVILTQDMSKLANQVSVVNTTVSGIDRIITNSALEDIQKELELLNEELSDLEQEEEIRAEDLAWTTNVLSDTNYLLTQPNNFLKKTRQEKKMEVNLALRTHLFVESMQFTDRPYSHIKLGLKPNQA